MELRGFKGWALVFTWVVIAVVAAAFVPAFISDDLPTDEHGAAWTVLVVIASATTVAFGRKVRQRIRKLEVSGPDAPERRRSRSRELLWLAAGIALFSSVTLRQLLPENLLTWFAIVGGAFIIGMLPAVAAGSAYMLHKRGHTL